VAVLDLFLLLPERQFNMLVVEEVVGFLLLVLAGVLAQVLVVRGMLQPEPLQQQILVLAAVEAETLLVRAVAEQVAQASLSFVTQQTLTPRHQ
jgi:hypothetical protein